MSLHDADVFEFGNWRGDGHFFFEKLLSTCTFFFDKHTCITLKETYKGEYIQT
jgi:hypothetical protein